MVLFESEPFRHVPWVTSCRRWAAPGSRRARSVACVRRFTNASMPSRPALYSTSSEKTRGSRAGVWSLRAAASHARADFEEIPKLYKISPSARSQRNMGSDCPNPHWHDDPARSSGPTISAHGPPDRIPACQPRRTRAIRDEARNSGIGPFSSMPPSRRCGGKRSFVALDPRFVPWAIRTLSEGTPTDDT